MGVYVIGQTLLGTGDLFVYHYVLVSVMNTLLFLFSIKIPMV